MVEQSAEDRPLTTAVCDAARPSSGQPPRPTRQFPPQWPAIASVLFGAALIISAYFVSAWVLNLNAYRTVAEAMAASMDKNDAAYRAGRERRPRIDPLNPATWSLESSEDKDATEQQRQRTQAVMRQIGIVEVGTKVWKLATWAIGGLIVLLGLIAIKAQTPRFGLLVAVGVLGLLATALTAVGMRILIVYGGFPPRPPGDYVTIIAAGSAYPWTLLVFLIALRCGARARPAT